jgi:uncharacterized protein YqfB (UPF0267 family)
MTFAIRKRLPTELEQKYAEMKKQSGDGKNNTNWVKNVEVDSTSTMPMDTVTLSSQHADQHQLKLKKSQPVSHIEKQVLHTQFSITA